MGGSDTRTVPGKNYKAVTLKENGGGLGLEEEEPCLEVQPSEHLLQQLEKSFVGELVHEGEARSIQQGLIMEGFQQI